MRELAVAVPLGDRSLDVFAVRPDGEPPLPTLIVAHEGSGLDEGTRAIARRFAAEGYLTLAPDLRYPKGDRGPAARDELLQAVSAALGYAHATEGAVSRAGIVGFGLGGFVALLAASRSDVASAVSFYGEGLRWAHRVLRSTTTRPAKRSHVPVLCVLGSEDAQVHAADVGAIRAQLSALRIPHEIVVYPRARAGFMWDDGATYQASAAADAWTRTLAWLGRTTPPERQPRGAWTRRRYMKR